MTIPKNVYSPLDPWHSVIEICTVHPACTLIVAADGNYGTVDDDDGLVYVLGFFVFFFQMIKECVAIRDKRRELAKKPAPAPLKLPRPITHLT